MQGLEGCPTPDVARCCGQMPVLVVVAVHKNRRACINDDDRTMCDVLMSQM